MPDFVSINDLEDIAGLLLAAGALGTASFGIVDALKFFSLVSTTGMHGLCRNLGFLDGALRQAYGARYYNLILAQYQSGRASGELGKTLRQGYRIGLKEAHIADIVKAIGGMEHGNLAAIAKKVEDGADLSGTERSQLARFEVAVDTRISAELLLAENSYKRVMRLLAVFFAVLISVLAGQWMLPEQLDLTKAAISDARSQHMLIFIVTGLIAVPIAPVAHDVAKALQNYAGKMRALK